MRLLAAGVAFLFWLAGPSPVPAQERERMSLDELLDSAGRRVEAFFARAQSLVCLETVRLQPLNSGLASDGLSRTVESELRLSWDRFTETEAAPEARTLREVVRVNGRPPRKDDYQACTTPEQQDSEPQPLSLLLPSERRDYTFSLGKPAKIDGRSVIVVEYRLRRAATVEVSEVEGQDDCISFEVDGGFRGRIWLDPDTHDVLRLDQSLGEMLDVRMPRSVARRPGASGRWFMERWDTTIRFKAVRFTDPDETLMLPASASSLRITRGSGNPRLRTFTEYSGYKRFLTGARVVP